MSGTWTAINSANNKIAWQQHVPFRVGGGGGSTTTAGGLVFHGDPGGEILARNAKTGEVLWRFQTGYGAEATPIVYQVDGDEYVAIAAGGNQGTGSRNGDAVWTFSLKGQLNPAAPPPSPQTVAGPNTGPIVDNAETIKIGANNVEFGYFPKRDRIKAGTTVTFTNAGDTPHTATSFENGRVGAWDTGPLSSGESKKVTFDKPGNYYYICTPHPWMYGQIIVE
jgi:plastocyanin